MERQQQPQRAVTAAEPGVCECVGVWMGCSSLQGERRRVMVMMV